MGCGTEHILPARSWEDIELRCYCPQLLHLLMQALRAAGYGIEYILPIGSCAGLDITQLNWKVAAYWQVCLRQ